MHYCFCQTNYHILLDLFLYFLLILLDWLSVHQYHTYFFQFSSVQLLSRVQLFATPWTAACQASPSFTNSWGLLKLMSIESVMPSNHLILCPSLLLLPSIFPSIRVFSKESVLCIKWPACQSFSFSISPSNGYSGLISWISIAMDRSPRNIFLFDGEHGENW